MHISLLTNKFARTWFAISAITLTTTPRVQMVIAAATINAALLDRVVVDKIFAVQLDVVRILAALLECIFLFSSFFSVLLQISIVIFNFPNFLLCFSTISEY